MEDIKKAITEAGLTDADLTQEIKDDMGDYVKISNGIRLGMKQAENSGKNYKPGNAEEKAKRKKERAIREIFILGEEKNSGGSDAIAQEADAKAKAEAEAKAKAEADAKAKAEADAKAKASGGYNVFDMLND